MKWVVWALLLVNVAIFGFFRMVANVPEVEPISGHEPISPEKIKILTPEELAALPKKTTPSSPQPEQPPQFSPVSSSSSATSATACYEWGGFQSIDAARAKAVLANLGLEAVSRQMVPHDAVRYWVYIPPRKSQEEAQAKIDELKALGVEDSYIVQEPVWRYAISLGVFKDESLANKFLEGLRQRGVKTAIKGRHGHEGALTSYTVRNVSPLQADQFGKMQPEFPGSEFKQVSCQ